MEFSVPRHGAAIVSGWCAALGAMLCLPFGKISLRRRWRYFCCGCGVLRRAGAAAGFVLRACGRQPSDASARPAFPVTRRIPLRFLAGCHIVQTPLQRMTGTCLFFLYSSGCTTLVPGMRKADAECLSAKLTHGGKLL